MSKLKVEKVEKPPQNPIARREVEKLSELAAVNLDPWVNSRSASIKVARMLAVKMPIGPAIADPLKASLLIPPLYNPTRNTA